MWVVLSMVMAMHVSNTTRCTHARTLSVSLQSTGCTRCTWVVVLLLTVVGFEDTWRTQSLVQLGLHRTFHCILPSEKLPIFDLCCNSFWYFENKRSYYLVPLQLHTRCYQLVGNEREQSQLGLSNQARRLLKDKNSRRLVYEKHRGSRHY